MSVTGEHWTLVQIVVTLLGLGALWGDLRSRIAGAISDVTEAAQEAERAHQRITELERDIHTGRENQARLFYEYQNKQARELATRETVREVQTQIMAHTADLERRLVGSVDRISEKLDKLMDTRGHNVR